MSVKVFKIQYISRNIKIKNLIFNHPYLPNQKFPPKLDFIFITLSQIPIKCKFTSKCLRKLFPFLSFYFWHNFYALLLAQLYLTYIKPNIRQRINPNLYVRRRLFQVLYAWLMSRISKCFSSFFSDIFSQFFLNYF